MKSAENADKRPPPKVSEFRHIALKPSASTPSGLRLSSMLSSLRSNAIPAPENAALEGQQKEKQAHRMTGVW
jgi:hypothetical protein